MTRLAWLFAALLFSAVAAPRAHAQSQTRVRYSNSTTQNIKVLAGVALNASPSARTFTLDVGGRNRADVQIDLTARAAATSLTMQCKVSLSRGGTYVDFPDQNIGTPGTGTLTAHVWQLLNVSAPTGMLVMLNTGTWDNIQCTVGGASGGGGDLFDVYVIGGAGL